jgi:hypothetical protein
MRGESGRNKIAKRFEETNKVKRRAKIVKRGISRAKAVSRTYLDFVAQALLPVLC